jgi:hypothetical protein
MYVDGIPVVLNGGAHAPTKKRGSIRLSHGFHFLMVDFFEGGGGALLDITYSVRPWPLWSFKGGGGGWSRLVFFSGLINSMLMFGLLGVCLLLLDVCACLLPPVTTCLMRHPRP